MKRLERLLTGVALAAFAVTFICGLANLWDFFHYGLGTCVIAIFAAAGLRTADSEHGGSSSFFDGSSVGSAARIEDGNGSGFHGRAGAVGSSFGSDSEPSIASAPHRSMFDDGVGGGGVIDINPASGAPMSGGLGGLDSFGNTYGSSSSFGSSFGSDSFSGISSRHDGFGL